MSYRIPYQGDQPTRIVRNPSYVIQSDFSLKETGEGPRRSPQSHLQHRAHVPYGHSVAMAPE